LADTPSPETSEPQLDHLTAAEIQKVLEFIQDVDAVVVGGQSLAIWSRYYLERVPKLAQVYSMSSDDVDLYGGPGAAQAFARRLTDAKVYTPKFGDPSPNAATVVGMLGKRKIHVDFLRAILGVDSKSIARNFVTLTGPAQAPGKSINILLLHPLDCLRSRFSIRDRFLGKPVHTKFKLDPYSVMLRFRLDKRIDQRWRSHQLANALSRLQKKAEVIAKNAKE
jgi:hypothetical protein